MKAFRASAGLAALVAAFFSARPASAQHDFANTRASIGVSIVPALSVQKSRDLVVGASGPSELAADSAAVFQVTGPAGGTLLFTVALPSSTTARRVGGSETITVEGFHSNLSSMCPAGASGCALPYTLLVGATARVDSNQRAGQYVGTFTVTVHQL